MKHCKILAALAAAFLSSTALMASEPAAVQQPVPEKLDLQTALAYAVDHNFAIREARERIRQQEGVVVEVTAGMLPSVAASSSYSFNDKEISTSLPATDKSWGISLSVNQTLYAGGAVSASNQAARLSRDAAMLELQGVINDQLLLVRTKFYTVLLNHERISVQEANVKLLEEQLRTARNRFDAGAVSHFEVLRAEVALSNGKPPLIQAKNDFRLAVEELRQVLGFTTRDFNNLSKIPDFVGSLEVKTAEVPELAGEMSTARENRPEIKRIDKLADAGKAGVEVARAGYKPTVGVYGRYDFARGTPTTAWSDRRDGWTAGVQAQWNIFDGRATAGRVVQAKSKLNQMRLSLDETQLAIDVEVRRAHSLLQQAKELVESTGAVVSQAEEALRLATVRYGAGSAMQLDVMTSQVALTEARLNQLSAFYNYNVALASLRKATGRADNVVTK